MHYTNALDARYLLRGYLMDLIKKISKFDLNLLTVFVAIDEYRHITKAAKVLGITQPALSHALGRLRSLLGDKLFVKSSQGMVPTPKSEQLSVPIRALLHSFETSVLGAQEFNPKTLKKTFTIHTTDLIECLALPKLLQSLENEAPHLKVVSRPAGFSLPREEMERGTCDVAIAGFFGDLPDGFYQQKLFTDHFQTAVRQNHPRLRGKKSLTLDEYCNERHVLIAPGGELRGRVDDILKKKKRERQIVAGLNVFMSSAWIISQSDYLLTGPSRLLGQSGQAFPIQVMAAPIEIPSITIVQVWHERNHQDQGHKWVREHIRKILQE